jgi:hypothetical protein
LWRCVNISCRHGESGRSRISDVGSLGTSSVSEHAGEGSSLTKMGMSSFRARSEVRRTTDDG